MNVGTTVSTLILAGGQSSRMGQDKALLSIEGQPLLARICQVADRLTSQVYVLTPWRDRYEAIVPPYCQFLLEDRSGEGPLVALRQGFKQIETEWILLLACDLPLLRSDILLSWIHLLDRVPDSVLAMVPYRAGRWEPLCGFYRQQATSDLESFIQAGGRSFQGWLHQISVLSLSVGESEARMLLNCNTPDEFAALDWQKEFRERGNELR